MIIDVVLCLQAIAWPAAVFGSVAAIARAFQKVCEADKNLEKAKLDNQLCQQMSEK